MALTSAEHSLLPDRVDSEHIVLATSSYQLIVRTPRKAKQAAKVGFEVAEQLHGLVVEDAEESVLPNHCQDIASAVVELELIDS